jgi:hypothetical protein
MNEQELREALDACRPGSDDLRQPEMASLAAAVDSDPRWQAAWARAQRCDAAIQQAFAEVSVPAGLCERLLATVAEPVSAAATSASAVAPAPTMTRVGRAAKAWPAWSRRWRFQALALASIAAAVTLLLVFRGTPGRLPELSDEFSQEVITWTEQVQQEAWREDLETAVYPLDQAIRATPRRWAQLATTYDRQTLVYDLTPPGRDFAFAFCIPVRGRPCTLPALPPAFPFSTTGGVAMGAWQTQDLVYVLVVQGGQNRYQAFMKSGLLIGHWRP